MQMVYGIPLNTFLKIFKEGIWTGRGYIRPEDLKFYTLVEGFPYIGVTSMVSFGEHKFYFKDYGVTWEVASEREKRQPLTDEEKFIKKNCVLTYDRERS